MKTFTYEVICPQGLHAINSAGICRKAREFGCRIDLEKGGAKADCKNVISLMSLGVQSGDSVGFSFDGEDEGAAEELFREFVPQVL